MEQEELVKIFKALANENRLKILEFIRNYQAEYTCCPQGLDSLDAKDDDCTCCVDEIGEQFDMAQSTISQHLKELYNAGLLRRHKRARWVYYTINPETVEVLREYMRQLNVDLAPKES